MSDSDSFINEVTEEVRRDHLFRMMRRYGWIPALAIVLIVGGATFNEYRKSQAQAAAQILGDEILTALEQNDAGDRVGKLTGITAETSGGQAVLQFLTATAQVDAGQMDQAVASLQSISRDGDVPEIYRQIANFKALTLQSDTMPASERRVQFEALAQPGARLRLLAEEQLALIDIAEGKVDAALTRLQAMMQDAELDANLQQRVTQVIVALGGEPDIRSGGQG